jgi:2-oxoglutarate ferredoxin oxidoreductase subunit beta
MDNQTYGLTKGQSSPTSQTGYIAGTSPQGNPDAPINGLSLALAAGGTFLARGFSAHPKILVDLLKQAIEHEGFSLVEVMSPCVTYNKINTYAWFKENTYYVTDDPAYDPANATRAFGTLASDGKMPLGVIYREQRPTFEALTHLPDAPIVSTNLDPQQPELAAILNAYH